MNTDEQAAWAVLVSSLEQGLPRQGELDASEAAQDLLAHFLCIPDQRRPEWVIHLLAAGAVFAGIRSYAAITGWVEDVPADLLTWLYVRFGLQGAVPVPLRLEAWGAARPGRGATAWRRADEIGPDVTGLGGQLPRGNAVPTVRRRRRGCS